MSFTVAVLVVILCVVVVVSAWRFLDKEWNPKQPKDFDEHD